MTTSLGIPLNNICRVYWGSHGCQLERGHEGTCECSCCMCDNEHTHEPDLTKPYIYVPLHMQPEATTCPMGGVFADQVKMVELLAAYLPPTIRIYIKEHPYQTEVCRSKTFYQQLLDIPSITFVPRNCNTFTLAENALAVASVTGTAGFEGIFKRIPFLMFGHKFFQYAPGVFRIHTKDDCKNAIQTIMEDKNAKPTINDLRLYLKAIELTGTPYVGLQDSPITKRSKDEKAKLMGIKIAEKLQPYLTR